MKIIYIFIYGIQCLSVTETKSYPLDSTSQLLQRQGQKREDPAWLLACVIICVSVAFLWYILNNCKSNRVSFS